MHGVQYTQCTIEFYMIMWKPNSESTTTLKQVDYQEPAKSRAALTAQTTGSGMYLHAEMTCVLAPDISNAEGVNIVNG